MKVFIKGLIITTLIFSSTYFLYAGNNPIIFIHGQHGGANDKAKPYWCWRDWNGKDWNMPYRTAMDRILTEHYGGYTAGSPLDCDKDSSLVSTGGETRKIYNFSYYHPDGNAGVISLSEESVHVYISHGYTLPGRDYVLTIFTTPPSWGYDYSAYWPRYIPWVNYGRVTDPNGNGQYWCLYISLAGYNTVLSSYINSWKNGKYAKRLAEFIDKVLAATGASKVDIVAHSMGGLVARAAIKYYGCDTKVRKLLTIGTPNKGWHGIGDYQYWQNWFYGHADWQLYGEDLEMNVDPVEQDVEVYFTDLLSGNADIFANYLTRPSQTKVSTIAGTRGSWVQPGGDDGLVLVSDVSLSWADFNPKIYASHGWGNANNVEEICLLGCTYTLEFIKNWIIDDDVSHNGATVTAYPPIFFYPDNPWDNYEIRVHANIDDYQKVLALSVIPLSHYLGKGFPLYKYQKGIPNATVGDPIVATWAGAVPPGKCYLKVFLYDMDGMITEGVTSIDIEEGAPASVEILEPSAGNIYTVQTANDKLTVQFKANFHWANLNVYFSPGQAGGLYPVYTATNLSGNGETKTIQFAMPQVNSPYCRVFVRAWLDC